MGTYNYIITSNSELYHYGIKGQKWGIRRYQNADGSLTPKGKKRLAKMEKYRDKMASKAQKNADRHAQLSNEAKANVRDLKKHGANSETYKRWKAEEYDKREREYESNEKNKIKGPDGETYVKKYSTSSTRFMDDILDWSSSSVKVQELIDENNHDAKRYQESAKRWANNNKNLMNMNVTALTKKSEIRKTYRSTNVPNTTGKLVNLDMVDERTGKKTRTVTAHESIYTENELRKKEREANKTGNYRKIYV